MSDTPEAAALEAANPEEEVARLRKEVEKLRKESAERRIENRGLKLAQKFDPDVLELVPKDLGLEEAEEYAQKLTALKGGAPAQEAATEAQEQEAVGEAPVATSPLAAVSQPSTGTESTGRVSNEELRQMLVTDPHRATELIGRGLFERA